MGESTRVDSRLELTGVDSVGGGDNSNEVEVEEEEEYDKAMETFSRTQSCWEIPYKQRMILLVWKHGEKFAGEGAECKLCKKVYSAKQGNTSNLINLTMY